MRCTFTTINQQTFLKTIFLTQIWILIIYHWFLERLFTKVLALAKTNSHRLLFNGLLQPGSNGDFLGATFDGTEVFGECDVEDPDEFTSIYGDLFEFGLSPVDGTFEITSQFIVGDVGKIFFIWAVIAIV